MFLLYFFFGFDEEGGGGGHSFLENTSRSRGNVRECLGWLSIMKIFAIYSYPSS